MATALHHSIRFWLSIPHALVTDHSPPFLVCVLPYWLARLLAYFTSNPSVSMCSRLAQNNGTCIYCIEHTFIPSSRFEWKVILVQNTAQ
ncbi:hypothetical protein ACTXT7_017481 [Hymenolepis weldensis]